MEMHVFRTIDLELFVDAFIHMLLVQTLPVNTHFLSEKNHTETGSLIFLTPSGLLAAIVLID